MGVNISLGRAEGERESKGLLVSVPPPPPTPVLGVPEAEADLLSLT